MKKNIANEKVYKKSSIIMVIINILIEEYPSTHPYLHSSIKILI